MADFETNLVTIAKGRFGKDVRGAIYDTIKELYTVGSGYTPTSKSPLNDTSDGNIKGIRVRAHSTQNGTPAPNNPVDIVDASKVITTHNGSETDYKSSSITLNAVIFASVDDVADEIVIDAKTRRGIFYKRVARKTFKNSITEKWREYISDTNQFFILEAPNPKPDYTKHIYSDRFVYGIPAPLITTGGKIYCAPTDEVWLVFPANTFTNIDAFKSWLETNNVVVEYALKNPSEQILSEEQVDEILSLKTFEGTTYVDAETDVEITYSIGWKTYIDNADAEINERIDELASNPSSSLVLTNPSPLPCTDGKKILGIHALGKSEQKYGKELIARPYADSNKTVGTTTFTVNNDGSITVSTSNGTADEFATFAISYGTIVKGSFLSGCPSGGSETGYEFNVINNNGYVVRDYGSGAVAEQDYTSATVRITIHTNAKFNSITFRPSMKPTIPTPTNPIPIIDASEEVTAIGKNLFDKERCVNGYLDGNGNVVSNPQYRVSDYIEVGHSQITISGNKGGNEVICFFAEDKTRVSFFAMGSNNIKTLDVPQNAKYVRCTVSADNLNIYQVEIGATATSYVTYRSNSVSLPFEPKSVGSVANELIVNEDGSAKIVQREGEVDLGTLEYTYTASWGGHHAFTTEMRDVIKIVATNNDYGNIMCDKFSVSTRNIMASASAEGLMCLNTYGSVIFATDTVSSIADFKTAMSGTILRYELATPIETPLTPEEVASIRQLMTYKGTTVIDSEMQIDSVTYSGDIKAYVDSKTDYSYTDTIIGKWADGKDLHRIVVNTNTPSSSGGIVIPFLNGNNCDIKNMYGFINWTSDTKVPINYYSTSTNFATTYPSANGIVMSMGNSLINKPCEITVEYTLKDSAPAAASVMSLDDNNEEETIIPSGVIVDDTVVLGGGR